MNRKFGVDRCQAIISKLTVAILSDRDKFGKAMSMVVKGIKTGFRFVFSLIHETENIAEATKDWASY